MFRLRFIFYQGCFHFLKKKELILFFEVGIKRNFNQVKSLVLLLLPMAWVCWNWGGKKVSRVKKEEEESKRCGCEIIKEKKRKLREEGEFGGGEEEEEEGEKRYFPAYIRAKENFFLSFLLFLIPRLFSSILRSRLARLEKFCELTATSGSLVVVAFVKFQNWCQTTKESFFSAISWASTS